MSKEVLILSNHFITTSFIKEFIQRLLNLRYDVYISVPDLPESKYFNHQLFRDMGCIIVDTPFSPRGLTPLKDLGLIIRYIKIINEIKPDVIFSYTIKPNIFGSIASNITKTKQISTITGTGRTFLRKGIVNLIIKLLYKISIKRSYKIFFQNKSDLTCFVQNKLVKNNFALSPGLGVNIDEFQFCKMPSDEFTSFIFIGRIESFKGIDLFMEAAKFIKENYSKTSFYVAGFMFDQQYKKQIEEYESRGIITYLGHQMDIKPWIQKCHCTILPSLREGISTTLLESAAMGRACIASDVPGCRDVIEDGVTGYLFKCGNTKDLITKMEKFLALEYQAKVQMGVAGRAKVEREFDRQIVVDAYMKEVEAV